MKKIFKYKNLFLVTFLAIAGFFSAGAFVLNKQAEESPIMEKADAATTSDGSAHKITVVDYYFWGYSTLHIWDLNLKTIELNGTDTTKSYSATVSGTTTAFENFLNKYYGTNAISRGSKTKNNSAAGGWAKTSDGYDIWTTRYSDETHDGSSRTCWQWSFPSFVNSMTFCYTNGGTYGATNWSLSGSNYSKKIRSRYEGVNTDADWGASSATANYDCYTFKIYGAGLKSGLLVTDNNQIGYYYYNPAVPAANDGEVFAGWFTDSNCTTPYTLAVHNATFSLYAKFVSPKYVYFTDSLSWGGTIQSVSTIGSVNVTYDMRGLYSNSSSNWVYYSAVPSECTKLKFRSGTKYTSNITITSELLDNKHAWYPSGSSSPYTANVWTITADRYPLKTGDKIYIYCDGIEDSGCGYAVHFYNKCGSTITEAAWSSLVTTEVTDAKEAFGVSYKIYEITVPGVNQVWANIIGTRYNTGKTPSSDGWSGVYNQTFDLALDKEITTLRFKSYNEAKDDRGNKKVDTDETALYTRPKVYSTIYGYHVLNQTNGVCNQAGGTNLTTLASRWSTLSTEYNGYDSEIQGAIWVATTTGSDNLSKGMARYDYIYHKYGADDRFDDFIGRGSGDSKSPGWIYGSVRNFSPMDLIIGDSETDVSVILIIVASSISILSITALSVLMVKKRKSKEQ